MIYQDNDMKFIAVLNRKIAPARLLNALGHMSAGLPGLRAVEDFKFLDYVDGDANLHQGISQYPFIVLQAENANQVRVTRSRLIEAGLPFTDFTDTMIGVSAEDQLQKTRARREADLEYFGICTFGPTTLLAPITKRFSLFRFGPEAVAEVAATASALEIPNGKVKEAT